MRISSHPGSAPRRTRRSRRSSRCRRRSVSTPASEASAAGVSSPPFQLRTTATSFSDLTKWAIEPAPCPALPAGVARHLVGEPRDTRIDVPVATRVDGVVEEQVAAGPDERAPPLEVGTRALVGVVAVDEQQLERRGRRVDGARVADEQLHLVRRARSARSAACNSASSRSPGMSGRSATCRSYDQSSTPSRRRVREHERAAALEAPDLGDRPGLDVACEAVEQRRFVDLQRRDAVVQLVRREEERQVLEAAHVTRPVLDVREAHRGRVAEDRCVDQVLADRRSPEPADDLFEASGRHGPGGYCNERRYAQACRARPAASAPSAAA